MWLCGSLAGVIHLRHYVSNFLVLLAFVAVFIVFTDAQAQTTGKTLDSGASEKSKSNNNANKTQNNDVDGKNTGQAVPLATTPQSTKSALDTVELEPTAHDFESIGMKIQLPKGSLVAKDSVGNAISWMVADERDPARWLFRLQAVVSSDPQSDTELQMQNHLQSLKAAGSEFTLLMDRPTKICGLPARFFGCPCPLEISAPSAAGSCCKPELEILLCSVS